MGGTEADARSAGEEILEVVVGVGNMEETGVLDAVAVNVADERGFKMVVEV